jgi:hypothetical protein
MGAFPALKCRAIFTASLAGRAGGPPFRPGLAKGGAVRVDRLQDNSGFRQNLGMFLRDGQQFQPGAPPFAQQRVGK